MSTQVTIPLANILHKLFGQLSSEMADYYVRPTEVLRKASGIENCAVLITSFPRCFHCFSAINNRTDVELDLCKFSAFNQTGNACNISNTMFNVTVQIGRTECVDIIIVKSMHGIPIPLLQSPFMSFKRIPPSDRIVLRHPRNPVDSPFSLKTFPK